MTAWRNLLYDSRKSVARTAIGFQKNLQKLNIFSSAGLLFSNCPAAPAAQ